MNAILRLLAVLIGSTGLLTGFGVGEMPASASGEVSLSSEDRGRLDRIGASVESLVALAKQTGLVLLVAGGVLIRDRADARKIAESIIGTAKTKGGGS